MFLSCFCSYRFSSANVFNIVIATQLCGTSQLNSLIAFRCQNEIVVTFMQLMIWRAELKGVALF